MNTEHTNKSTSLISHPWEKYLPSKKIRVVLIILIVVAVLYGIKNPAISFIKKTFTKPIDSVVTIPVSQNDQPKVVLSTDKDTDGDGLADWQETLIGTDPEIPNSQEEVPQSFRELLTTTTQDIVETEDKLALKVYQRLLTDPKGNNIEEAVQAATTKELLDLADTVDQQQTTYTLADLNLIDDTPNDRSVYKKSMERILTKINPSDKMLESIYDTMLSGKPLAVDATYRTLLAGSITTLLDMEVPLKLGEQHLILLNAMAHAYGIAETASAATGQTDESMRFVSFLVFQKNLNLSHDTIFVIFKMLS